MVKKRNTKSGTLKGKMLKELDSRPKSEAYGFAQGALVTASEQCIASLFEAYKNRSPWVDPSGIMISYIKATLDIIIEWHTENMKEPLSQEEFNKRLQDAQEYIKGLAE